MFIALYSVFKFFSLKVSKLYFLTPFVAFGADKSWVYME